MRLAVSPVVSRSSLRGDRPRAPIILAACALALALPACGPPASVERATTIIWVPIDAAPGNALDATAQPPLPSADRQGTVADAGLPPDADSFDGSLAPSHADASTGQEPAPGPALAADAAVPDATSPPEAAAPNLGSGASDGTATLAPATLAPAALAVTQDVPSPAIDLTSIGALDWAHFGLVEAGAINRKRAVPALISMTTTTGAVLGRYSNRPVEVSWSDGVPTERVTGTRSGAEVSSTLASGFELRAAGDPARARRLEVFLGGWAARGRLTVRYGAAAPVYTDVTFQAQDRAQDRVYRIWFRPTTVDIPLVVQWSIDQLYDEHGNVTLQAAALAE